MRNWTKTNATFSDSDPEVEALNESDWLFARRWVGDKNVWIAGPIGTGKSFMAMAMGKSMMERFGSTGGFQQARDVLEYPKAGIKPLIDTAMSLGVLMLDDLDKIERRHVPRLYDLLEERHRMARPTIITANSSPDKVFKHFKELCPENTGLIDAALDRIRPCRILRLKGESLRKQFEGDE